MDGSEMDAIHPDNLLFGPMIGHGEFCDVNIAKHRHNNKLYAVKIVVSSNLEEDALDIVKEQVLITGQLRHMNLLPILTSVFVQCAIFTVMPLMDYGSCASILLSSYPTGLPEEAVSIILNHVLKGLEYLHSQNYVHRGVKAAHILIRGDGMPVLSGFKFTVKIPEKENKLYTVPQLKHMKDYLNWLSPELLSQDKTGYGCNSDVYSVGVTACELANGQVPYMNMSPGAMLVTKLEESSPKLWDKSYLPASSAEPVASTSRDSEEDITIGASLDINDAYSKRTLSKDFHNFTNLCLTKEPFRRPTSLQMMNHKFVQKVNNESTSRLLSSLKIKSLRFYQQPLEPLENLRFMRIRSPPLFDWEV